MHDSHCNKAYQLERERKTKFNTLRHQEIIGKISAKMKKPDSGLLRYICCVFDRRKYPGCAIKKLKREKKMSKRLVWKTEHV